MARISPSMRSRSSGENGRSTWKSYWNLSLWSVRPTSIWTPGKSRFTASAMTCSAEWRSTSPAAGSRSVTISSATFSVDGRAQVDEAAVDATRDGVAREAASNERRDLEHRRPRRHFERPPIGQSNGDGAHDLGLGMDGLAPSKRRRQRAPSGGGRHGRGRTADLRRVKAAL